MSVLNSFEKRSFFDAYAENARIIARVGTVANSERARIWADGARAALAYSSALLRGEDVSLVNPYSEADYAADALREASGGPE